MSLRYEDIVEILKIIDSSSCDELIVETGDMKLVVRRNGATGHMEPASDPAISPTSTLAEHAATVGEAHAAPIKVNQRPAKSKYWRRW